MTKVVPLIKGNSSPTCAKIPVPVALSVSKLISVAPCANELITDLLVA
jgi:hypothetical protein